MADYLVVNGSRTTTAADINAAGVDVPPSSVRTATLDNTELAALCAVAGIAVMKVDSTYTERRLASRALKYRKNEAGAAL